MDFKLSTMKKIFVYTQFLLTIVFTSCNYKTKNLAKQESVANKHKWLKDYALCSCIKYCFKEDTIIKNDLSFAVYHEISDYSNATIYRTIDSLSKDAALNIEPSQIADHNGRKALLQGCINFYESKKLDSIVNSFDNVSSK